MLAEVENKAQQYGLSDIITTFRANIENTPGSPINEHSMDWVLIANILHQSDPTKVFQEARRVVSAKGHIVVVGWAMAATPLGPPNERRISEDEVKRIAAENGLDLTKEFAPSPYHYGLIMHPKA
jgi:ubiquinone/menaquinone biosynthesis C-methylase UbiE